MWNLLGLLLWIGATPAYGAFECVRFFFHANGEILVYRTQDTEDRRNLPYILRSPAIAALVQLYRSLPPATQNRVAIEKLVGVLRKWETNWQTGRAIPDLEVTPEVEPSRPRDLSELRASQRKHLESFLVYLRDVPEVAKLSTTPLVQSRLRGIVATRIVFPVIRYEVHSPSFSYKNYAWSPAEVQRELYIVGGMNEMTAAEARVYLGSLGFSSQGSDPRNLWVREIPGLGHLLAVHLLQTGYRIAVIGKEERPIFFGGRSPGLPEHPREWEARGGRLHFPDFYDARGDRVNELNTYTGHLPPEATISFRP